MKTYSSISELCSQLSYSAPCEVRLGQSPDPGFKALLGAGLLRRVAAETIVCPGCGAEMVYVEPLDPPEGDFHFCTFCDGCGLQSFLSDAQACQYSLVETALVALLQRSLGEGPHDTPGAASRCCRLGKSRTSGNSLYFAYNPARVDCSGFGRSETAILVSGSGLTGDGRLDRRVVPLSEVLRVGADGRLACSADAIDALAGGLSARPRGGRVRPAEATRRDIAYSRLVQVAGMLAACIQAARECSFSVERFTAPSASTIAGALKGTPVEVGERQMRRILNECVAAYRPGPSGAKGGKGGKGGDAVVKKIVGGMLADWDARIDNARTASGWGRTARELQITGKAREEFSVQLLEGGGYQIRRAGRR